MPGMKKKVKKTKKPRESMLKFAGKILISDQSLQNITKTASKDVILGSFLLNLNKFFARDT